MNDAIPDSSNSLCPIKSKKRRLVAEIQEQQEALAEKNRHFESLKSEHNQQNEQLKETRILASFLREANDKLFVFSRDLSIDAQEISLALSYEPYKQIVQSLIWSAKTLDQSFETNAKLALKFGKDGDIHARHRTVVLPQTNYDDTTALAKGSNK